MEAEFWIQAWQEGRTGFHQAKYNDKLTRYLSSMISGEDQCVFVPLCGKTKDMLWLAQQGLRVYGVELYEKAVKDFFSENHLPSPRVLRTGVFTDYAVDNITISVGDAFMYKTVKPFDLIYDRASLVALPARMRSSYATLILSLLKNGGKYLLLTYEYDEMEMQGPPFSVPDKEVRELFGSKLQIKLLETSRISGENPRFSQVPSLVEKVYLLT